MCLVERKALEDSAVILAAMLGGRDIGVGINENRNIRFIVLKLIQQRDKLGIDQDEIGIAMLENVGDVLRFQAVVDGDVDGAGRVDAK